MNMKEVWSPVCIREIHQFTLDFENWFWEGQYVNVVTKSKSLSGVKISLITNGNTVQFMKDEQVIVCKYEDIVGIDCIRNISSEMGTSRYNNDGWFAYKTVSSFSFDLNNWFSVNQTVTIEAKGGVYKNAVIKNVIDTRNLDNDIYVVYESEDGKEYKINTSAILNISHAGQRKQTL